MKTIIREYTPKDKMSLIKCMEALQDYEIHIDNLKRKRRLPGYGKYFTNKLLKQIKNEHGKIFVAVDGETVCGYVAGVTSEQTKESLLKKVSSKFGHVLDLYVDQKLRSKGIGRQLMQEMEKYFKKQHCTVVLVGVMAVNKDAHKFYQELKYLDRSIEMIKIIN